MSLRGAWVKSGHNRADRPSSQAEEVVATEEEADMEEAATAEPAARVGGPPTVWVVSEEGEEGPGIPREIDGERGLGRWLLRLL